MFDTVRMDTNVEQIIGERVRRAREEAGITKTRFCLMANISRPYLDRIENGKANVSIRMLVRLAGCLDLEVVDLVR